MKLILIAMQYLAAMAANPPLRAAMSELLIMATELLEEKRTSEFKALVEKLGYLVEEGRGPTPEEWAELRAAPPVKEAPKKEAPKKEDEE